VVAVVEHGALAHHGLAMPWLAVAAAAWTFAELARPTATPYVALAPAIAAAIFEPAFVALPAIAAARLVGKPSKEVIEAALRAQLRDDDAPSADSSGRVTKGARGESGQLPLPIKGSGRVEMMKGARESAGVVRAGHVKPSRPGLPPRWLIAAPIAGAFLVVLAIIAGTARDGSLGALADVWYGPRVRDAAAVDALTRLADAFGPLAVVAVAGGLAVLARVHLASLAVMACAIGCVLVDLRAGSPGATSLGLGALCAGAGIARLAGMIRLRSGQAIAAATCGAMLLVPPVWTVIG
jgi:hypothetical protein